MLHVHRAERGSALVAGLADLLAEPAGDPFAPEVVAVPARGVERWLAQRLAHRLGAGPAGDGVCAHVLFPSPHRLLDDAVAAASPDHAAAVEAWSLERAVWPLVEVLDACPAGEDWCAGLRHHLGLDGDGPSTRRYAVARRVAGLFGAYAAARPRLLRAWAAGGDDVPPDLAWQPELWRRLRARIGVPSPAELLDDACAALRERPGDVDLPSRVSLYGVSRVDTARLRVLAALAAHRDVHLWLHAASPALWDAVAAAPPAVRRADAAVPVRHPLLASLSRDVRELQLRLAAVAPGHATTHHPAEVEEPASLLARLQADLRDDAVPTPSFVLPDGDRSVQVHACHGRARQVEVLREVVLGLLADDPTLEPRDVLVLCPDVEAYAPLVAAAFGTDSHPGGALRVQLADRAPRQVNGLLAVAARLLELAGSRVTAPEVLDLAGSAPVRRRFELDDDDVEQLRGWAVDSGVRWGLDAARRARWSLDRVGQGTWRAGLDRVLTGVALQESAGLLGGALPLDAVDSSDVALAGRLAELLDRVGAALDRLQGPQPVDAWLDALEESVDALAEAPADGAWQRAQLGRELAEARTAAAGSTAPLVLADVVALLAERLAGRPTTTSFRTGGLTVCTLTPMRSVPHRVVCLLGLDDGAFPRHGVPDGDDLLARDPHVGERDLRSEDRQLLLDALMAAQEHLVVTYAGSDVRTGAALAPAVPLGELLDALDATAVAPGGGRVRDAVVVRHPLQPFDPRSFAAGRLGRPGPLSFDASALAGALAARGRREAPPPFLADALPPRPPEDDVELGRLVELLQHPVRGLLRQRLDVALPAADEEPQAALPVALGPLEEWGVGDRVLAARLDGADAAEVVAREAARGDLPPGALGTALLREVGTRVDRLCAASEPHRALDAVTVDVEVALPDGRRLLGPVRGVRGDTVLAVTYSRVRAKQRLRAWVELLALTAARPDREVRAVLVGRAAAGDTLAEHVLGPVPAADAVEHLAALVSLRDAALCAPLPLPVAAAEAYAQARRRGSPPSKAFWPARKAWTSEPDRAKEDADPEHVLVHGPGLPFEQLWASEPVCGEPGQGYGAEPTPFARLARRLWEPLLEAERTRTP